MSERTIRSSVKLPHTLEKHETVSPFLSESPRHAVCTFSIPSVNCSHLLLVSDDFHPTPHQGPCWLVLQELFRVLRPGLPISAG